MAHEGQGARRHVDSRRPALLSDVGALRPLCPDPGRHRHRLPRRRHHYVLTHDRWFKEYVLHYTNAATLIQEGFRDTEDLGGLFSGLDPETGVYDPVAGHWGYEGALGDRDRGRGAAPAASPGISPEDRKGVHGYAIDGGARPLDVPRWRLTSEPGGPPPRDPTLQHPRCVFQILKRHFSRYTPEMVSQVCGCSPEQFTRVAELLCANSGRERTSVLVYALGWTQHAAGAQMIRAGGILQLLLGNIGRPGGGILAANRQRIAEPRGSHRPSTQRGDQSQLEPPLVS
jgi:formate dehydrogenase major subunit